MGFRFRKSIKILPGVKLNVGKKGVGISAGVKGARVSVNSSGRVTKSVGIPGTGISYVESSKIGNSGNSNSGNENITPTGGNGKKPAPKSGAVLNIICKFIAVVCFISAIALMFMSEPSIFGGLFFLAVAFAIWFLGTYSKNYYAQNGERIDRKKAFISFVAIAVIMIGISSFSGSDAVDEAKKYIPDQDEAAADLDVDSDSSVGESSGSSSNSNSSGSDGGGSSAAVAPPAYSGSASSGSASTPTAPAAPETPAVSTPEPSTPQTAMVYISQTGSKYHSNPNCSNMKSPSQVSLEEAQSMGLGPCSRCY